MDSDVSTIPAVHDWHLERVLADLGLLLALDAGELRCACCQDVLSLETIGGILVRRKGRYSLVCSRIDCIEKAPEANQ